MAFPKIKLVWGSTRVLQANWRLGLFGFYERNSAARGRSTGLAISLRGALVWLGVLLVAAYFAGAGVIWFWLERRPYNFVTYADLVLPTRWAEVTKLRGQGAIAEGVDDFKNHKWREGMMRLSAGLSRYPQDSKARLALAHVYLAVNQRKQAKTLLTDGFAPGYPGHAYVREVCGLAADSEDYDWFIATCDTAMGQLAALPGRTAERRDILQQKLAALLAAGRADEVLRLVAAEPENGRAVFREFNVLALLACARPAEAVAALETWRKERGLDPQVARLQIRAFREAGRFDDMERSIEELRAFAPTDAQPYIYGIIQRFLAGRRTEADRGLDNFLLRFGGSPEVVRLLAAPLAEINEQAPIERLMAHARDQGFDLTPFRQALLRVRLHQGDWVAAWDVFNDIKASLKTSEPGPTAWAELMGRMIKAALDPSEGAQSRLTDFVRERQLPLKTDRELITVLRRAGRPATARTLITFAQGVYPENATLETWRKELDRELAAAQVVEQAAKPVVSSKAATAPSAPAGTVPAREEISETIFFKRLAEAEKAGNFEGELRQILELRLARPDWLAARQEEILGEEIRLNGRVGDLPALHLAASLYLNGDKNRAMRVVRLARELHAAGCKEAAMLLAQELLRKIPNYPPAKRLLAEWGASVETGEP
jgi:hypothetical protein